MSTFGTNGPLRIKADECRSLSACPSIVSLRSVVAVLGSCSTRNFRVRAPGSVGRFGVAANGVDQVRLAMDIVQPGSRHLNSDALPWRSTSTSGALKVLTGPSDDPVSSLRRRQSSPLPVLKLA